MLPNRNLRPCEREKEDSSADPRFQEAKNDKLFIYLPVEACRDTNFPLKDEDRTEAEIKGETPIIKKTKEFRAT
jgi:hypothetical protein